MVLSEEHWWMDIFRNLGALWVTDGNPRRPHAELASGRHSGGYFNAEKVAELPSVLDAVAVDLVVLLSEVVTCSTAHVIDPNIGVLPPINKIYGVVGPAMGAITLAHDVARRLTQKFALRVRRAYVEKDPAKSGAMTLGRCEIREGATYLLVEDVTTTFGTLEKIADVVRAAGGVVYPVALAIMNRSGSAITPSGLKITSLSSMNESIWDPADCPLCRAGSVAVRPKLSWAVLNDSYEEVRP
jgi:orotate phosphoribosyltransferase